jgi:hypothetical protein
MIQFFPRCSPEAFQDRSDLLCCRPSPPPEYHRCRSAPTRGSPTCDFRLASLQLTVKPHSRPNQGPVRDKPAAVPDRTRLARHWSTPANRPLGTVRAYRRAATDLELGPQARIRRSPAKLAATLAYQRSFRAISNRVAQASPRKPFWSAAPGRRFTDATRSSPTFPVRPSVIRVEPYGLADLFDSMKLSDMAKAAPAGAAL